MEVGMRYHSGLSNCTTNWMVAASIPDDIIEPFNLPDPCRCSGLLVD
jgi:hypothetical protein